MVSATTGTVFHGSHLPLRLWFRAIWWFTNQKTGISALGLQRALGLGSYRTAWMCLHKLRRAMVRPNREPLAGKVEVDELYIGGKVAVLGEPKKIKERFVVTYDITGKVFGLDRRVTQKPYRGAINDLNFAKSLVLSIGGIYMSPINHTGNAFHIISN